MAPLDSIICQLVKFWLGFIFRSSGSLCPDSYHFYGLMSFWLNQTSHTADHWGAPFFDVHNFSHKIIGLKLSLALSLILLNDYQFRRIFAPMVRCSPGNEIKSWKNQKIILENQIIRLELFQNHPEKTG